MVYMPCQTRSLHYRKELGMYKSLTVKIDDLIIELVERKKKHVIHLQVLDGSITYTHNTSAKEYRVRGHFRYFQGHKGGTV